MVVVMILSFAMEAMVVVVVVAVVCEGRVLWLGQWLLL